MRKIRRGGLGRCLISGSCRLAGSNRTGERGPVAAGFQVAVFMCVRGERTNLRMIGTDEARVAASQILFSRYFLGAEGMVCSRRVAGWWIGISS